MIRFALILAVTTAAAAPSFAQSTTFYITQDLKTKKCMIVDKKPVETTTIVGDGVYKTHVEAETALKTVKVCSVM